MPKIILKCGYFKAKKQTSPNRQNVGGYVNYIATRKGVEKISDSTRKLPATMRQSEMLQKLLVDFPDSKDLFEYEDYLANPSRENASEFIRTAIELNMEQFVTHEGYLSYIATRPNAERSGAHGLFTDEDNPSLELAKQEAANHSGNIWTQIISLRRGDAARLGYDNAAAWRALIKEQRNTIAKELKISPHDLKWYASFHDEGHHPHIHMVAFSADPKQGYLTKQSIEHLRSGYAKSIFKQDLISVYAQQTEYRDELVRQTKDVMSELVSRMRTEPLENASIENLLTELADRLSKTGGKKVYGYLKTDVKSIIDSIVDELEKVECVAECYGKWQEMRDEVLRTYKDTLPPRLPLSQQNEFKQIKNAVIAEAMKLTAPALTFEDEDVENAEIVNDAQPPEADPPQDDGETVELENEDSTPPAAATDTPASNGEVYVEWTKEYKEARVFLFGDEDTPPDFAAAFERLTLEAENGNALAMHDLGRMFADGLGRDADADTTYQWYAKALAAFHIVEDAEPKPYTEYRIGKMYNAGLGTELDYEKAAQWFTPAAAEGRSKNGEGNKYAQYSLGGLYYKGNGVAQNYETALHLYQKSDAQDFPYASYELAKMYRNGIGTAKDENKAGEHFKKAFTGFVALEKKSHDDKLQYRIGQMLLTGTGTEKDLAKATEYFEKSARLGNTYAQYQLAKIYLADEAADPFKIQDAIAWLTKSAEGENQFAQYALAKLYRDGTHVDQNEQEAVRLFTLAAEQENEYAAYALGKLHLKSDTLQRDVGAAVKWLTKAADLGNQFAQYTLGKLYLLGDDVPKDIAKAVALLDKAAEQQNQFAQYQLGKLYLVGEDVPKDVETAIRWLSQAAEQGNQFAQYTLGKLYLMGKDIPRDREKALEYFMLAAEQGNEYAQFFIDHMDSFRDPSLSLAATNLLRHLSRIFEDKAIPDLHRKAMQIDRKRRQKLAEKKQAQGHARDDHTQEFIL